MHDTFKSAAKHTIDVLLKFSISQVGNFKITAFRALKDFIMLNIDCLVSDMHGIICALVHGSASDSDLVRLECANAFSYLVSHHIVYTHAEFAQRDFAKDPTEFNPGQAYIIDALLNLTGSDSLEV